MSVCRNVDNGCGRDYQWLGLTSFKDFSVDSEFASLGTLGPVHAIFSRAIRILTLP